MRVLVPPWLVLLASRVTGHKPVQMSALQAARALAAPIPKASVQGEYEDAAWWDKHERLLARAREEWGRLHPELYTDDLAALEESFIRPDFRDAVAKVWEDPTPENEAKVLSLVEETTVPGVYSFRLFTDAFIQNLLEELDHHHQSGIPLRRPNGMNRYGAMLSALGLDGLVDVLVDRYFRSMAMLLFPRHVGPHDTADNYAFVVRYKLGQDVDLAQHTDSSTVTVNLCLGKEFEGGELYFRGMRFAGADSRFKGAKHLVHEPGRAIIHLGQNMHGANPLTAGERINIVVWMYGRQGYVRVMPYTEQEAEGFAAARWRHVRPGAAWRVKDAEL